MVVVHLNHMKKCILAFLLLVISSASFTAKGQSPAPIKTAKVDSAGEEEIIACFFPEYIGPEFPGGTKAWLSFIRKNLKYPRAARKAKIQGTVIVAFTVNLDGKVNEIEAVSGPDELKQAAMDVIKKSPNWKPAIEKGHNVKRYEIQPIVFRIEK
jgi:protein TonB